MIAYSDLVAALRHWRERNGLPNFGTDPGPAPAVVLKAAAGPPGPPPGLARSGPPAAPGASVEVHDEIEAHEIESEEIYEGEGSDFALSFAGAPRPSEPTVQGVPPGYGTDPNAESKFPGITGYTDPGITDPETFGVTATLDDDFVSESSPAPALVREGTKPGIGSVLDADTDDQTLPPTPPPAKKKKKR